MTADPEGMTERQMAWVIGRINEQVNQTKSFIQSAAEFHVRDLKATEARLIFWCGVIVTIGFASAGFRIGAIGVAAVVIMRCYWWTWYTDRFNGRVNHFRARFRDLLEKAEDSNQTMLSEDKEFLQKYTESVLFPLAAPRSDVILPRDLVHFETLYREYNGWHRWHKDGCKLCAAAQSVRGHLNNAISKIETTISENRQGLIAGIDGRKPEAAVHATAFLGDFCEYERSKRHPQLATLVDKEYWTFEEAEDVLRLYRKEEEEYHRSEKNRSQVLEKLPAEIEEAAFRCKLAEVWWSYQEARRAILEVEPIRRFLRRRDSEALFREMAEGGPNAWWSQSDVLRSFGYDRSMVERAIKSANKLMLKESQSKEYEKQLGAANLTFSWYNARKAQ